MKRITNEQDRRFSRIVLAENVTQYIRDAVPQRLLEALGRASADERGDILSGLRTLKRLLETTPLEGDEPPGAQPGAGEVP